MTFYEIEFSGGISKLKRLKKSHPRDSFVKKAIKGLLFLILPILWIRQYSGEKEFSGIAWTQEDPQYAEEGLDPNDDLPDAIALYFRMAPPYLVRLRLQAPTFSYWNSEQRKNEKRTWYLS